MDMTALKSPTCAKCAMARGLEVPGGVHTIHGGTCANCGTEGPVSPADDWRPKGTPWDGRIMD
jgi:hypothetical protein